MRPSSPPTGNSNLKSALRMALVNPLVIALALSLKLDLGSEPLRSRVLAQAKLNFEQSPKGHGWTSLSESKSPMPADPSASPAENYHARIAVAAYREIAEL